MARGALHVDAEKDLRDILRELQLDNLTRVDGAAPLDAVDEAIAITSRADEFAHHAVVGFVVDERLVQPGADLLAATIDEAGASVIVTEQVVPESEPVLGIGAGLGQQALDQQGAPFGRRVSLEFFAVGLGWQLADEVEVNPAEEGVIIGRLGQFLFVTGVVGIENAVNGMLAIFGGSRESHFAGQDGGHIVAGLETEARVPRQALIDPDF